MIQAVLFDWDGTLLDSKDAILASYRDATSQVLGAPFPVTAADVTRVMPMRAQESFGTLSEDPETVTALIAAYHRAYLRNSETLARPFPGALETLADLRRAGLRLGVVTSKGRDRVDSDAARYGLSGFEVIVSGDVSAERKPHPGPVLDALTAMGVEASLGVLVGDGPQDVIAGRAAGVVTVGALYGFHTREEIQAERPDFVVASVSEVRSVVERLRAGG